MANSYSPQDVAAAFAGILASGFSPDTFITVTQESDSATATRGADGLVVFAVDKALPLCTLTLTLMQTSNFNNVLAQFLAVQNLGAPAIPVAISSFGSTEGFTSQGMRIAKSPDVTYAQGIESREWTLTGPGLIRAGGTIL